MARAAVRAAPADPADPAADGKPIKKSSFARSLLLLLLTNRFDNYIIKIAEKTSSKEI